MSAYYNEFDPYASQWLRNLIAAGHIALGDVDDRDMKEVHYDDIKNYDQCHFFAGVGGWSLALRYAGWDNERPVWTGSCPCQPFSGAGKGEGTDDSRHLWPEFRRLISHAKPPVIFGEQVASKLGRSWLSTVRSDLEAMGYGVGAADLCAASAGAPHIRQRLWWMADTNGRNTCPEREQPRGQYGQQPQNGCIGGVGDPKGRQPRGQRQPNTLNGRQEPIGRPSSGGGMGQPLVEGLEGLTGYGDNSNKPGRIDPSQGRPVATPGDALTSWSDSEWPPCTDGKARPIEPGTFPLALGVPNRVGKLRAYGNAICPQVAAEFIMAYAP
jgi:DNA (cytosine-5)-methyltransferase 1